MIGSPFVIPFFPSPNFFSLCWVSHQKLKLVCDYDSINSFLYLTGSMQEGHWLQRTKRSCHSNLILVCYQLSSPCHVSIHCKSWWADLFLWWGFGWNWTGLVAGVLNTFHSLLQPTLTTQIGGNGCMSIHTEPFCRYKGSSCLLGTPIQQAFRGEGSILCRPEQVFRYG